MAIPNTCKLLYVNHLKFTKIPNIRDNITFERKGTPGSINSKDEVKCMEQGTFHQLWFKRKRDGYGIMANFTHSCRSYLFSQHVLGNKI